MRLGVDAPVPSPHGRGTTGCPEGPASDRLCYNDVMAQGISLCFLCIHYREGLRCKAFPKGIPKAVLKGEKEHREPFPWQNNTIVFTPRKPGRAKRRQPGASGTGGRNGTQR